MFKLAAATDDLFKAGHQALVNPTNTNNGGNKSIPHGFMGGGLAAIFDRMFPGLSKSYYTACSRGLEPGSVHTWKNGDWNPKSKAPKFVINFPTMREIGRPAQMQYVVDGLRALADTIKANKITSVGIPALGCGIGGLDWEEVRPTIERWAATLDGCTVCLYPPRA